MEIKLYMMSPSEMARFLSEQQKAPKRDPIWKEKKKGLVPVAASKGVHLVIKGKLLNGQLYQNEIRSSSISKPRVPNEVRRPKKKKRPSGLADPNDEPGDLAYLPMHHFSLPGPKWAKKRIKLNRKIVKYGPSTVEGTLSAWG